MAEQLHIKFRADDTDAAPAWQSFNYLTQGGLCFLLCFIPPCGASFASETDRKGDFKYPAEIRKIIYATNTIEGFNRQLRKVTKSKSVFPTDDSLLRMLYLAMIDIARKWTGCRPDWGLIHSQLEIYFVDRLPV